jgi:hypothetical protein
LATALALLCSSINPLQGQDITAGTVDLGDWASLNTFATTNPCFTTVLTNHLGRIHIGHLVSAGSDKPNAPVYYDTSTGTYGSDKDSGGTTPFRIDNVNINYGVVQQGDLLWSGEDGAVQHNGAWLYVKRQDGWRSYTVAANAHRQAQYIYDGKIFLANDYSSKPGVGISYDGGATLTTKDQRSTASGADFPYNAEGGIVIAGWLTHSFFEFKGSLFALNWTGRADIGLFPPQEAWMTRYTDNQNFPWERTWRRVSELGMPGRSLDSTSVLQIPKPIEANGYLWLRFQKELYRYGAESVTGVYGSYQRPSGGTRVSAECMNIVARHGFVYRLDRTSDTLTLRRTSDGNSWTTLGNLNIAAGSTLGYLQSATGFAIEIAGEDIYIGGKSRLYKVPGSVLGSNKHSGVTNTAPVATNDTYTANYGLCRISTSFQGPLLNDKDPNGDPFYASIVTAPAHGRVTMNYNGTFDYAANGSFPGTDSFTYKISDGFHESTATITLNGTSLAGNPAFTSAKVNFQNPATVTPSGYVGDTGGTVSFKNNLTYGWNTSQTGTKRNINADVVSDTLVTMTPGAVWQLSVPNGTYEVKAGIGDAGVATSNQQLNVEGVNYFMATSTAANEFLHKARKVNVSDSWLTVDCGGSTTRLNYLEIQSAYTAWANLNGVPPVNAAFVADPDMDGISNLNEYAHNLNPTKASTPVLALDGVAGLPNISTNPSGMKVVYLRRKDDITVTYKVQFSDSPGSDGLGGWADYSGGESVQAISAEFERVTVLKPVFFPRLFARVKVSKSP